MDTQNELVILTKQELETIIYRAVNSANSQLYDGLEKRYLGQFEKDMRLILAHLDVLKRGG